MQPLTELEHENQITDILVFDMELYIVTSYGLRIFAVHDEMKTIGTEQCIKLKQVIPLKQKNSKVAFFDDQLCVSGENEVSLFEFFRFNEMINMDQKLTVYRLKPVSPQFVKFDLEGDFVATGSENSILVYSTATMDLGQVVS